jgi:hypothetical protein
MPPKKDLKKVTKSTKKAGKQPANSLKNYTLDVLHAVHCKGDFVEAAKA